MVTQLGLHTGYTVGHNSPTIVGTVISTKHQFTAYGDSFRMLVLDDRGFKVFGSTEEKSFDRRRVVYDLAPLSDEVDAIRFLLTAEVSGVAPARGRAPIVAVDSTPLAYDPQPISRSTRTGAANESAGIKVD